MTSKDISTIKKYWLETALHDLEMAPQRIRNVIKKFVQALRKAKFPPCRVIIFGSYARGEARPDSDIDLCLIGKAFKQNREKFRREAVVIAFGVDPRIQIVTAGSTLIKTTHLSSLYSHIQKEGIVVA